ncbi:MAG: phage holin family protein [Oscillospiraceae bacterium]|nr:phage holin family protein [Oscillospiraceae bacterium]
METSIISVAGITVISYLVAQGIKATKLDSKWLPVICGACGAALGLVGMVATPGFPAGDPVSAAAVGIVSGLAATGSHEIYKQLGGERK